MALVFVLTSILFFLVFAVFANVLLDILVADPHESSYYNLPSHLEVHEGVLSE